MARRITSTEAARRWSEILDAVEHRHEEFVVERHGRDVAAVAPARGAPSTATWRDVLALLETGPRPDAAFASDMRRVRRTRPSLPKDPWARSSTPRS